MHVRCDRGTVLWSGLLLLVWLGHAPAAWGQVAPPIKELRAGAFAFEERLHLRGSPEAVYDAITGEVSDLLDHTFSDSPKKLVLETHPGGGFDFERFAPYYAAGGQRGN